MNRNELGKSPARYVVPFAIVGCFAAAVAAWTLVGVGPAEESVIAAVNAPWFGARMEVRRLEPITVVGHRTAEPTMTASARGSH